MNKLIYSTPELRVKVIGAELPVAASNKVASDGNSIEFNPSTMTGGSGGDAVKHRGTVVWDDWDK